jgi:hypothetical protein
MEDEGEVAECGGGEAGMKAVEQCYNIHGLWLSFGVDSASTTIHPKPVFFIPQLAEVLMDPNSIE